MPRMPKSTTPRRRPAARAAPAAVGQRDAEAVVAEEDVADPGDEDAPLRRGAARGRAARPRRGRRRSGARAAGAEVAARVVLDDDREVDGARRGPARAPRRSPSRRPARGRRRRRPRAGAAARGCRGARAPRRPRRVRAGPLELLPAGARSSPAHPELADRPVQAHQLVLGVAPRCARGSRARGVRGAHLGLLLVGQAEDVQHEQLVDLAAVEEVAGALGGDPRMVLEDDRRGQQRVALALARRRAPARCPRCAGRPRRRAAAGGSVSETNSPPRRAGRCASSRTCAAAPPRASPPRPRRRVLDPHGDARAAERRPARPTTLASAAPSERTIAPAAPSRSASTRAGRRRDRDRDARPPARASSETGAADLALDRLVPGQVASADRQLVDGLEARRARRHLAPTTCRKRTVTSTAVRGALEEALRLHHPGSSGAALAVRAGRRRRRSSAAGS